MGYNQPNHTGFYFGHDKDTVMENEFRLLENQNWKKAYAEKEGQKSEKNWYIDGEKGSMKKDGNKIILEAGPDIESEDDHIVMWSKKSFKGDIMIDYEFTKLDSLERFVNIIYIQATGNNALESPKDISKWKEKRKTPLMSHYYNNMNLTHLSYAAFENKPDIRNTEYIRARRYMPDAGNGLKGTEFPEEYLCPLLFETGIKHKLTIIKQDGNILFRVKTENRTAYYKFTGDSLPDYEEGAIGFRQMHGRNSSYENIVVYTKND